MLGRGRGIIFEITDGDAFYYRGNLFYDLVKISVIRLAFAMARELRKRDIVAVALTPGFLRSEAVLDHFGVREANWKDVVKKSKNKDKNSGSQNDAPNDFHRAWVHVGIMVVITHVPLTQKSLDERSVGYATLTNPPYGPMTGC